MEFNKVIKTRKSIRLFLKKRVPSSKIKKILKTIRLAPSAGHLQAYKVWLISNHHILQEFRKVSTFGQDFSSAPCLLVFAADPSINQQRFGKQFAKLFSLQDATIACAHAQLSATDVGLSSVWIGAFSESRVKKILNLKKSIIPVALLPVGFAAEPGRVHTHKKITDLIKIIK